MKIELSPREVSILVECCCRAPACVEAQTIRELIHKLKFSYLELEPFRRTRQIRIPDGQGCDEGDWGESFDLKKVNARAIARNVKLGHRRKQGNNLK